MPITKKHTIMGNYKKTSVDLLKEAADFRLLQTTPYVIKWKNGKIEKVHGAKLKKLQKTHSWTTDF